MKIYLISLTMLINLNACKEEMPEAPLPQSAGMESVDDCVVLGSSPQSIQSQLRKLEIDGKINSDEKYQLAQYSNYMDISSILGMLSGGGGFDISSLLAGFGGGAMPDLSSMMGGGMPDLSSMIGGMSGGSMGEGLTDSPVEDGLADDAIDGDPSQEDSSSGC